MINFGRKNLIFFSFFFFFIVGTDTLESNVGKIGPVLKIQIKLTLKFKVTSELPEKKKK